MIFEVPPFTRATRGRFHTPGLGAGGDDVGGFSYGEGIPFEYSDPSCPPQGGNGGGTGTFLNHKRVERRPTDFAPVTGCENAYGFGNGELEYGHGGYGRPESGWG